MSHPPYRTRSDTLKLQRLIHTLKERGSNFANVLETTASNFLCDVKKDKTVVPSIPHYDPGDDSDGSSFEGYPEAKDGEEEEWGSDWEEDTGEEDKCALQDAQFQCDINVTKEPATCSRNASYDYAPTHDSKKNETEIGSKQLTLNSKNLDCDDSISLKLSYTQSLDKNVTISTKSVPSSKKITIPEGTQHNDDSKREILSISKYPYRVSTDQKKILKDNNQDPIFSTKTSELSSVLKDSPVLPSKFSEKKSLLSPSKELNVKLNDTYQEHRESNSIKVMSTKEQKLSIETSDINDEVEQLNERSIEDFKIQGTSKAISMDLLENDSSNNAPLQKIDENGDGISCCINNSILENDEDFNVTTLQEDRELSRQDDVITNFQKRIEESIETPCYKDFNTDLIKCIPKDNHTSNVNKVANKSIDKKKSKITYSKEVTLSSSAPATIQEKHQELKNTKCLIKELKKDSSSSHQEIMRVSSEKQIGPIRKSVQNKLTNEKKSYPCMKESECTKVEISKNKSYTSSIKSKEDFKERKKSVDKEETECITHIKEKPSVLSNTRLTIKSDFTETKCTEMKNNSAVTSKKDSFSQNAKHLCTLSKSGCLIDRASSSDSHKSSVEQNHIVNNNDILLKNTNSNIANESSNNENIKSLEDTNITNRKSIEHSRQSIDLKENTDDKLHVEINKGECTKVHIPTSKLENNNKSNESPPSPTCKQIKHVSFDMTDSSNLPETEDSDVLLHEEKLQTVEPSQEISSTPVEEPFSYQNENKKEESNNSISNLTPKKKNTKPGRRSQTLAALWRKNKEKQRKTSNI
nr:uncharacterized protein DDB_G0288805-like [Lepeophtheirus salmonis]